LVLFLCFFFGVFRGGKSKVQRSSTGLLGVVTCGHSQKTKSHHHLAILGESESQQHQRERVHQSKNGKIAPHCSARKHVCYYNPVVPSFIVNFCFAMRYGRNSKYVVPFILSWRCGFSPCSAVLNSQVVVLETEVRKLQQVCALFTCPTTALSHLSI